jgi:glycosyltransferase involved in cell wall biosynthesis
MGDFKGPQVVSQIVGRWDDFNYLRAFHEIGALGAFATDIWWPKKGLGRFIAPVLPQGTLSALERCYNKYLDQSLAHIDPGSFFYMLALRSGFFPKWQHRLWRIQGRAIGKATRELAIRRQVQAVFAYSYYAKWTFDGLPSGINRLMHQVHPYAPVLNRIYKDEIERGHLLSEQLLSEIEMTNDTLFFQALTEGPLMAHQITAASSFTRATLVEGGIDPQRIIIIPYGADLSRFTPSSQARSEKAKVLFVGSVTARKGIGYLLEAWRALKPSSAELVIAGRLPEETNILHELNHAGVTVMGRVTDRELIKLFQSADLFCMPSIAEGFGLVYLQALACGTPILGTTATAAADIINDHPGVGFVVESRSVESLASSLEMALSKLGELRRSRDECVVAAQAYTWSAFRRRAQHWFKAAVDNGNS